MWSNFLSGEAEMELHPPHPITLRPPEPGELRQHRRPRHSAAPPSGRPQVYIHRCFPSLRPYPELRSLPNTQSLHVSIIISALLWCSSRSACRPPSPLCCPFAVRCYAEPAAEGNYIPSKPFSNRLRYVLRLWQCDTALLGQSVVSGRLT